MSRSSEQPPIRPTLRVHTLARELRVESRIIIARCKDAGIVLHNHMAVVSPQLAAQIRIWFWDEPRLKDLGEH